MRYENQDYEIEQLDAIPAPATGALQATTGDSGPGMDIEIRPDPVSSNIATD